MATDEDGIKLLTQAEQAKAQIEQRHQQLLMQAQNEFQQARQAQIAADRRYTEQQAKANAAKIRQQGSGGRSSGRVGSPAPLSEFNSSKFPGWKP